MTHWRFYFCTKFCYKTNSWALTSSMKIMMMVMVVMMMMMICFFGIIDRWKTFGLIFSCDHCLTSSSSRFFHTPRAGFKPVQTLTSGFVEWSFAVLRTTAPRRFQIYESSFLHETYQLDKFEGADFKYALLFSNFSEKYPNKAFLVPYLGILTLAWHFAIRQIPRRWIQIWQ